MPDLMRVWGADALGRPRRGARKPALMAPRGGRRWPKSRGQDPLFPSACSVPTSFGRPFGACRVVVCRPSLNGPCRKIKRQTAMPVPRRPLRNEFGAASRRSLALGPGSHSADAARARESSGGSCAQPVNRARGDCSAAPKAPTACFTLKPAARPFRAPTTVRATRLGFPALPGWSDTSSP